MDPSVSDFFGCLKFWYEVCDDPDNQIEARCIDVVTEHMVEPGHYRSDESEISVIFLNPIEVINSISIKFNNLIDGLVDDGILKRAEWNYVSLVLEVWSSSKAWTTWANQDSWVLLSTFFTIILKMLILNKLADGQYNILIFVISEILISSLENIWQILTGHKLPSSPMDAFIADCQDLLLEDVLGEWFDVIVLGRSGLSVFISEVGIDGGLIWGNLS